MSRCRSGVEDNDEWWEVELHCDPHDQLETLWRLLPCGFAFFVRDPDGDDRPVRAYVPRNRVGADHFGAAFFSLALDARDRGVEAPNVSWRPVRSIAIPDAVKERWPVLEVGAQILVVPAWAPAPEHAARRVIRIDPCSGFGDGTHPTTALCLEALETLLLGGDDATPGAIVADVGCGTGICALAAIALGAARAHAVDTDPAAVRGARRNRDLNVISIDRVSIEQGSLESLATTLPEPVDILVCNLYAEALVELAARLRHISHPRTRCVLSGLRSSDVPALERALADAGWQLAILTERDSWCCLVVEQNRRLVSHLR